MNRTQKTAWLNVSGFLMGIILAAVLVLYRRGGEHGQ